MAVVVEGKKSRSALPSNRSILTDGSLAHGILELSAKEKKVQVRISVGIEIALILYALLSCWVTHKLFASSLNV